MPRRNDRESEQPKLAVMILNHNGLRWLSRCLSSLTRTNYSNYETYLIDNGSSDGSAEYVRQQYPSVKVIKNSANLGFANAYNKAISEVEAEYIVLLNNDTEVLNPEWLSSLVETASEAPNVAAVATKMVSMKNHQLLDSVGGTGVPYWREGFQDIGKGEPDVDQYSDGLEPFTFCGGAALIRKSAFIDAGKFDREFFLYYEDPDLSWRLRLRGWRVRYTPRAKVAHFRGGTAGGGDVTTLVLYYCHRNFLRAIIKNCGSSLAWALRNYLLFTFLTISGHLIYEPRRAIVLLKGIAWNLRNLKSAYAARRAIQSRRNVSEPEILRSMYPNSPRKQPVGPMTPGRILKTLFEYSDRSRFQSAIERLRRQ